MKQVKKHDHTDAHNRTKAEVEPIFEINVDMQRFMFGSFSLVSVNQPPTCKLKVQAPSLVEGAYAVNVGVSGLFIPDCYS